jgi:VCBS repeat-containing protein
VRRHVLIRRAAIALLSGLLILPLLTGTALAAPVGISAKASMAPVRQFLGDTSGTLLKFAVRNTSASASIGAIQIKYPSSSFTVLDCPSGPAGWTRSATSDRCTYQSAVGSADDIQPGQKRALTMLVGTTAGNADLKGLWLILISDSSDFLPPAQLANATPTGIGLTNHVFSFQLTDAVLALAPATVGSPCPAPNKQAEQSTTGLTVVLCGRNRTTTTRTLQARFAGLKGTFIHSHGAFTAGPVAPTASPVVLGNWGNVSITNAVGTDLTVVARVRNAANRTSPWKTMGGYESTAGGPVEADTPVANNDGYNTNEDTTLTVVAPGVLFNDTDANSDPLTVSSVNGSAASVGTEIATTNGLVTVNADGSFNYEPAHNYHGADSFSYTANDGTADSASGIVSITVNSINDAPIAVGDSVATTTTTPINIAAPGVLDNDSDADGDPIAISSVNGSSASVGTQISTSLGSVTVNADGSFSYQASAGQTGADSFTYTVSDGVGGSSNTATVSITVNASGGGGGGGGGCLKVC